MKLLKPKLIYINKKDPLVGIKIEYIIKKYKNGARYYCKWMRRDGIHKPFFDLNTDLEIDISWDSNEWEEYV